MQKQKGWGRTILNAVLTPEHLAAGLFLEEQEDLLLLCLDDKTMATWRYPWTRRQQPGYASIPEIRRLADLILRQRNQPEEQASA